MLEDLLEETENLVRFDAFLEANSVYEEIESMTELHGFLTAAISGPSMKSEEELLELILGEEAVCLETDEGQAFFEAVVDMAGQIRDILLSGLPIFPQYICENEEALMEDAESFAEQTQAWCNGYCFAIYSFEDEWDIEEHPAVLMPLQKITDIAVAGEEDDDEFEDDIEDELEDVLEDADDDEILEYSDLLDDEEFDDSPAQLMLPIYVNSINSYWRGYCNAIYEGFYESEEDLEDELELAEEPAVH